MGRGVRHDAWMGCCLEVGNQKHCKRGGRRASSTYATDRPNEPSKALHSPPKPSAALHSPPQPSLYLHIRALQSTPAWAFGCLPYLGGPHEGFGWNVATFAFPLPYQGCTRHN